MIGKYFFPKRLQKINIKCPPDINLKKPACASKQDGLVLATLQYLNIILLENLIIAQTLISSSISLLHTLIIHSCDWVSPAQLQKKGKPSGTYGDGWDLSHPIFEGKHLLKVQAFLDFRGFDFRYFFDLPRFIILFTPPNSEIICG